jgi:hypothetical protein
MAFQLSYEAGKQFTPDWADIKFSDFQAADMNNISANARGAQLVADKRIEELNKKRDELIDKIKLNKRFSDLEQKLYDNVNGILENAGNVQLSDNANYTRLSTDITKAKNDPVIKEALYTTENAKKYQELRESKPDIVNQPWNNPNEDSYKRFTNGETDAFEFQPVYEEYDFDSEIDSYTGGLKSDEIELIAKHGVAGIYNLKKSGNDVDSILAKIEPLKKQLLEFNPKSRDYFKRRSGYDDPNMLLDNAFKKAAIKHASIKQNITQPQVDPNVQQANEQARISQGWGQLAISQAENARKQIEFDAMNMDPTTFANTKGYEKYNRANLVSSANNSNSTKNSYYFNKSTGELTTSEGKFDINEKPNMEITNDQKNVGNNFTNILKNNKQVALKDKNGNITKLAESNETSRIYRNPGNGKITYEVKSSDGTTRQAELSENFFNNTLSGVQSGKGELD